VEQPTLFALPPRTVPAAPLDSEHEALATQLGAGLRMGTMSWSFAGWRGIVYGQDAEPKRLAEAGLTAYSAHALLRAVEIDRSFYEPLPAAYFEHVQGQVPESFRFLVKAHEDCTQPQFPRHARYGKKQGQRNERFLNAGYAVDAVIGPAVQGLGQKLAALLFSFRRKTRVSRARSRTSWRSSCKNCRGACPTPSSCAIRSF
jgi:uncharacterized protein YecE (DUF72 family)